MQHGFNPKILRKLYKFLSEFTYSRHISQLLSIPSKRFSLPMSFCFKLHESCRISVSSNSFVMLWLLLYKASLLLFCGKNTGYKVPIL